MTNDMEIFVNFAEVKLILESHKNETLTEHTIQKILEEINKL